MRERIQAYLPKGTTAQKFTVVHGSLGQNIQPIVSDQWSLPPEKFPAAGSTGIEYQTRNAVKELSMNISALRNDIKELTQALKGSLSAPQEKVLLIRDISRADALVEVSNLLQASPSELYPSDISERLRIDYEMVLDVLKDLHSTGKVEFSHGSANKSGG
jgi:hypothetical protein